MGTTSQGEEVKLIGQKTREYMAEPILDWILKGIPNPPHVKLFDDVGFIYEAQLAKMELSTWWDKPSEFRKRAAYYEEVEGEKTYHYYISDIKGKGQIGRTNQYLTNWYYPYKAKFHPQMIKAIINWMGVKKGGVILDPFAGSGTTLIESKLLGIDSIGTDIDPLCVLLAKVKTDLLDLTPEELESVSFQKAFSYFRKKKVPASMGLDKFIPLKGKTKKSYGPFQGLDERIYNFYLLSYLYALSDWTYIKLDMWNQFKKNTGEMVQNIEKFNDLKKRFDLSLGNAKVSHGDGRFLTKEGIEPNSIDGIVTSPPYSIAVDYIKQDLHAFQYLGVDPSKLQDKLVGLKGKGDERINLYFEDMKISFESMYEVLKPKSYCSIVIGDVTYDGKRLPITDTYIKLAKETGFKQVGLIRRPILGGFARLRYENVILFQKP